MNLGKSLAANNRFAKAAIPTILLIVLAIISLRLIDGETSGTAVTILVLAYFILIILIVKGYKSKDIYYDNSNMYLKGDNGVLSVPFSRIRKIKLTLTKATVVGFRFSQYKIVYLDTHDAQAEIHFWTTTMSSEIDEFEGEIKKMNPYVKVEHSAIS